MKAIIHWNKQKKLWSIHTWRGCEWGSHIFVKGDWITEVKPDKASNPRGWVVVDRSQVEILNNSEALPSKGKQLLYDKQSMGFNITKGVNVMFLPEGAFLSE